MLDAVDRLKKNLHKEQGLLVQTLCASHQKLLAPEQVRICAGECLSQTQLDRPSWAHSGEYLLPLKSGAKHYFYYVKCWLGGMVIKVNQKAEIPRAQSGSA